LIFVEQSMLFTTALAPLLLASLATADVHRLKLKKLPPASQDPVKEALYLRQKYDTTPQLPLMGAGGVGRKFPPAKNAGKDDNLYWTQEQQDVINKGGHGVPLTSKPRHHTSAQRLLTFAPKNRLYERAVLH
jgi:saccharopepsin